MKTLLITLSLITISIAAACGQSFELFSDKFVSDYKLLNIPDLNPSYVSMLQQIGSAENIAAQVRFFILVQSGLAGFQLKNLNKEQQIDYRLIRYETKLNLQRLSLEKKWLENRLEKISNGGVYTIPDGKDWYAYLIRRWVDDDITPDAIFNFGMKQTEMANVNISAIIKKTGLSPAEFYKNLNDSSFYIIDSVAILKAFENDRVIIYSNIHKLFNVTQIPDLKIQAGNPKRLAQTPGFYDHGVFNYNPFDNHFKKRQVDWLFLHEAVPGHHYQASVIAHYKTSKVQDLFFYMGIGEGWGAYAEEYGKELGVYKTLYDEYGKWEWNLVRAVRIPIDVGINYYGWTDKQALAFWKKHVVGQDDIAMREISRVRRWPAQALTYKYGAQKILDWKAKLIKEQGAKFDVKDFHDRILSHGSLPLFMVERNVFAKGEDNAKLLPSPNNGGAINK